MKVYLTYRERLAGFFILATMALITLFIVGAAIENLWFTPTETYHVYLDRGEGLKKGAPVLLSGIEVGRIGTLVIMPDGRIDVSMEVLESYSHRLSPGTRANVRRAMGIGEKRIQLVLPGTADRPRSRLAPGSVIPVDEPRDLLDVISTIDLGRYMEAMDRTVALLEQLLGKMEEGGRFERMLEAFDQLGPTMTIMNRFFTEIHEPFLTVMSDPAVVKAFSGGAKVFNDPQTRRLIHSLSDMMDDGTLNDMLTQSDALMGKLNEMLVSDGHINKTLEGASRLMNDGKLDAMLDSMHAFTKQEKMERLIHNMTVLSTQMAKIGPEIPSMTREMNRTLRELSIVLKALQKTRILDSKSQEAIEEMEQADSSR